MTEFNNQGFTLIEVVIALALSVITVGAIYTIYLGQVKSEIVREDKLDMQQHARVAMDLIVRELNMAGYDPRHVNQDENLNNDFDGIAYHPTQLVVKADLNGNGSPTDSNESIQFSHDPITFTLRRDTGGGRQPLAEHVEKFSIKYFDHTGQITTNSQQIRQIELHLKARTERPDPRYPLNGGYRTFTLQARITPRNLGL
ncbi:MAG: PilW family protein [Nitrospirales bacterium]